MENSQRHIINKGVGAVVRTVLSRFFAARIFSTLCHGIQDDVMRLVRVRVLVPIPREGANMMI